MKNNIARVSIFLLVVLLYSSCQKVVDIDLNSKSPHIIIESEISDQPSSCRVKLTRTVNFNDANEFPPISNALVIISDNQGNSETLAETAPGIYSSDSFPGIPGNEYTLTVSENESFYSATSIMPYPVSIDTLLYEKSVFGEQKFVTIVFFDTAGIENYYRIIKSVNSVPEKTITAFNDYLQDGLLFTYPLFSRDENLAEGDTATVFLQSIDKSAYEFFRTLSQLTEDGGGQSASPANPTSNFSNGALGYFSAYSVTSKSLIIP